MDGPALHGDLQAAEILHHFLLGELRSQQTVDPFRFQRQVLGGGDVVDHVDGALQHVAGVQQLHQLTGPVHGGHSQHGIQILFKFSGGLRAHTQGKSGLPDGRAVEIGGLKDHAGSVAYDLGILAAHNAGQANGAVLVGNDQHSGSQLPGYAVQGDQLLACCALPDHDLPGGDIAIVERVHGLAVFQHDVVGDVDNIIDGADAIGA